MRYIGILDFSIHLPENAINANIHHIIISQNINYRNILYKLFNYAQIHSDIFEIFCINYLIMLKSIQSRKKLSEIFLLNIIMFLFNF